MNGALLLPRVAMLITLCVAFFQCTRFFFVCVSQSFHIVCIVLSSSCSICLFMYLNMRIQTYFFFWIRWWIIIFIFFSSSQSVCSLPRIFVGNFHSNHFEMISLIIFHTIISLFCDRLNESNHPPSMCVELKHTKAYRMRFIW